MGIASSTHTPDLQRVNLMAPGPTLPLDVVLLVIDASGIHAMNGPYHPTPVERADRRLTIRTLSALSLLSTETLDRCRHWIFRRLKVGPRRRYQNGLESLKEHERSLINAASEIFWEGHTDRLGRKPGDYVHSLSFTFPANMSSVRWDDIDLTKPLVESGLLALIHEYPNLNNLQLTGNRLRSHAIGGTALCNAISRLPLQRFAIETLDITTNLLQNLPQTLESFKLYWVYLHVEKSVLTEPALPLKMAALTGRVSISGVAAALQEVFIGQAIMSPSTFDDIRSLSYEIMFPGDMVFLHVTLNAAANTLEVLELSYYELENYDIAALDSALALFPAMPSLRTLVIDCPSLPNAPLTFPADYILSHLHGLKSKIVSITTLAACIDLGYFSFFPHPHPPSPPLALDSPQSASQLYSDTASPQFDSPSRYSPTVDPAAYGFGQLDELLSDRSNFASLKCVQLRFSIRFRDGDVPSEENMKLFQDQALKQLKLTFFKTMQRLGDGNLSVVVCRGMSDDVVTIHPLDFWCPA